MRVAHITSLSKAIAIATVALALQKRKKIAGKRVVSLHYQTPQGQWICSYSTPVEARDRVKWYRKRGLAWMIGV